MKEIHTFDYCNLKTLEKPNRIAVRAVIIKDDLLFLLHLEASDEYKFPGGGVEEGEKLVDALYRETLEESGAYITDVKECLGYIDQIYIDKYDPNEIFYMRSIYYLCEISDIFTQQSLSDYEIDLKFKPIWVTFNEAIKTNQRRIDNGAFYPWTERELFMLNYLKTKSII